MGLSFVGQSSFHSSILLSVTKPWTVSKTGNLSQWPGFAEYWKCLFGSGAHFSYYVMSRQRDLFQFLSLSLSQCAHVHINVHTRLSISNYNRRHIPQSSHVVGLNPKPCCWKVNFVTTLSFCACRIYCSFDVNQWFSTGVHITFEGLCEILRAINLLYFCNIQGILTFKKNFNTVPNGI